MRTQQNAKVAAQATNNTFTMLFAVLLIAVAALMLSAASASAEGWFSVRGLSVNTDTLDCRNWSDDQMLQTNTGLKLFDLYKDGRLGPADQRFGFDLPKVCKYIVIHRPSGGGGGSRGNPDFQIDDSPTVETPPKAH